MQKNNIYELDLIKRLKYAKTEDQSLCNPITGAVLNFTTELPFVTFVLWCRMYYRETFCYQSLQQAAGEYIHRVKGKMGVKWKPYFRHRNVAKYN